MGHAAILGATDALQTREREFSSAGNGEAVIVSVTGVPRYPPHDSVTSRGHTRRRG
jgi:hypothetical protein